MIVLTQVELENWVNSIHSACAAAFARHRGKTGTLHLLQEEIFRLEKAIESVNIDVLLAIERNAPSQYTFFLALLSFFLSHCRWLLCNNVNEV